MPLPHNARAPVNSSHPEPVGFCDRCGFLYQLAELVFQMQWAGPSVVNTFLRVCPKCLDVLNEQGRTIVIGPDPVPLKDPRPGYWASEQAVGNPKAIPNLITEEP